MALNFPNLSRSYDPNRRAVRFWGYDGVTEHLFVISEEALKRVRPGVAVDEASMLTTFDANRDLIMRPPSKFMPEAEIVFMIWAPATFDFPRSLSRADDPPPRTLFERPVR